MTDHDHRPARGRTRRVTKRAHAALLRRDAPGGPHKPFLEFDALAAYLGLLIGLGLGGLGLGGLGLEGMAVDAGSPAAAPILTTAAVQTCIAGAVEVGRDGAAECVPP